MNFEQLYRAHHAEVRRFALYLAGDYAEADDITSETFIRAWAADAPMRAVSLKAYLMAIARNLHRQKQRSRKWHDAIDEGLASDHPGPEAALATKRELQAVYARLQRLAEIDRAALLMRAFGNLSYHEIAAVLGISEASARVKVHRARNTITAHTDERTT